MEVSVSVPFEQRRELFSLYLEALPKYVLRNELSFISRFVSG